MLSGLNDEGDVLQRRNLRVGIGEGDITELDLAPETLPVDELLAREAFGGEIDDPVDVFIGGSGVAVVGQQGRYLPHGRYGPGGQDGDGDEASHGQLQIPDHVDAHHNDQDRIELDHEPRQRRDRSGHETGAEAFAGDLPHTLLPLPLDLAGDVVGLDGLDVVEGFDEDAVFAGRGFVGTLDALLQRLADKERVGQDDQHDRQGDEDDGASHVGDDDQEDHRKREVDQHRQSGVGQKAPDRIELLEIAGERPHGAGDLAHVHIHDPLENDGGHDHIALLGRDLQHAAAEIFEDSIQQIDDQDPGGKDQQGLHGIVGDDPVIDVSGKERCRQDKEVDQQRCQQHIFVDRPGEPDRVPEPVLAPMVPGESGSVPIVQLLLEHEEVTGVVFGQLLQVHPLFQRIGPGIDHLGHFPVAAEGFEDTALSPIQQQNHRQMEI